MDNKTIKETLEKQLQLLSERSQSPYPEDNLAALTEAMMQVISWLTGYDMDYEYKRLLIKDIENSRSEIKKMDAEMAEHDLKVTRRYMIALAVASLTTGIALATFVMSFF